MKEEEIVGGLKNALERGSSLDDAVHTMINAGYSPNDVKAAANSLSKAGVSTIIQPGEKEGKKFPALPKQPKGKVSPQKQKKLEQVMVKSKEKRKSKGKMILVIILAVVLLAVIGIAVSFIF